MADRYSMLRRCRGVIARAHDYESSGMGGSTFPIPQSLLSRSLLHSDVARCSRAVERRLNTHLSRWNRAVQ